MSPLEYASTFPVPSSPISPRANPAIDVRGYDILRPIGSGGCATVYEAIHRRHGLVALKVCDVSGSEGPERASRLLREAELASRVTHPNVVRILDFGCTDRGIPYVAM